ncbi:hypothetical protein [Photorhabdus heterorhabditis]|uniref:hypothetical protein n=1 Tax=Photorhabdus heterorhabditis TaxID=880156 RepID=UPI001BD4BE01|nr:hypothetical protein [Photorhabdus heterorhabditis]
MRGFTVRNEHQTVAQLFGVTSPAALPAGLASPHQRRRQAAPALTSGKKRAKISKVLVGASWHAL